MYSHYQSGNNIGGTGVTTTQQGSMTWNGSQWVQQQPQPTQYNYGAQAQPQQYQQQVTYQQQQQQQQQYPQQRLQQPQYQNQQTNNSQIIGPQPAATAAAAPTSTTGTAVTSQQLVTQYTNYYHQWTARHQECSKNPAQSNDALWAKYHADNASRAAHYFHNHPGTTVAPPELILPPAPPQVQQSTPSYPQQQQTQPQPSQQYPPAQQYPTAQQYPQQPQQQQHGAYQQQQQQQQQSNLASSSSSRRAPSSGGADDGMKRFVDRCLQACGGERNKAAVLQRVQERIQTELQAGTLHTTDWDAQPLITLAPAPVATTVATSSSQTSGAGAGGYYGPGAGSTPAPVHPSSTATTAGYYGPASVAGAGSLSVNGKKRKKWEKKSPNSGGSSNKNNNNSDGNYYGPNNSDNVSQIDSTADFISLPSHNKKIVKKKKKKAENSTGFSQSQSVLSSRADRFSGPGGVQDATASSLRASGDDSQRWHKYMGKGVIGGMEKKLTEADYEQMTIKGTCTEPLEKSFLRLTAPPRAELVRPQPILEQHLKNLKAEWWGTKKRRHDYLWFCSQLKAVRQDCTVQRIQNAFAVDVYETHARIALSSSDMNEYNQCQTQLKELYALLATKNDEDARCGLRNLTEFLSYRLIYYVFLTMESQAYGGGSSDMFKIMLSLTPQQLADPRIKHALAVREACCSDILDYHAFFRLRRECPAVSAAAHLLDRILPKVRHRALLVICRGYRPTMVAVEFVLQELGLDTKTETDLELGRSYLQSCGCVLSEDGLQLQTKDTEVHESNMEVKESLI